MAIRNSPRIRAVLGFVIAVAVPLSPSVAAAKRSTHDPGRSEYRAPHAKQAPAVDGVADEPIWKRARWQELKHRWLGPEYSAEDFRGRFKVVWTA
ncbi:MAG: CBM9 family sugar-binding protein, partial [Deltaproteobacteria bacterium]|nr:CBM9 family sugar-binding protein [Deltaproteobacteria bacterium]